MNDDGHVSSFLIVLALLGATVIFVPAFKRLGLGSVLGYLCAGLLLGPSVFAVVQEPEEILEFSELGVVFLLFLIGLELNPSRLWAMRRDIFGLGALQVLCCGALLMLYPLLVLERSWQASLVAGMGLALSSTALVMQIIEERRALRLPYGRKSFAVLLMQDIAIVPLLVLVALLAPGGEMEGERVLSGALQAAAALGGIVLAGRYLLSPIFRLLARFGGREVMTAGSLLVVLAAGTAMMAAGMSMAMGAFLAGVMLAESNFRHELEADIEPFRGLLLGLFFLSVGMSVNLERLESHWVVVLAAVLLLVLLKATIVYALVRLFGGGHATAARSGVLLAQGGEFGFVLYGAAAAGGLLTAADVNILNATVIISMAITPLTVRLLPLIVRRRTASELDEDFSDAHGDVLLIGFGRFGQLVAQMLLAGGYKPVLLDSDPDRITEARRFGNRVYYGDGRRLEVLRAAGAARCDLIAVCTTPDSTTDIVRLARLHFPQAKVFARAYDRRDALVLMGHEVAYQRREMLDSAIRFGREALVALGTSAPAAQETESLVRMRDAELLEYQRLDGIVDGHRKWCEVTPEPYIPPPNDGEPKRQAAG